MQDVHTINLESLDKRQFKYTKTPTLKQLKGGFSIIYSKT